MKKNLTCIVCPMGCQIEVEFTDSNEVINVTGNTCKRGEKYAVSELSHPVRVLTSTVGVDGIDGIRLPVKTDQAIPKEMIFQAMNKIHNTLAKKDAKLGDVIIKDIVDGVNLISCASIDK